MSIVRTAVAAAAPTLSVWTTTSSRTVPARFLATKELVADLLSTDPLLDSIAFSRGRFAIEAGGVPLLTFRAQDKLALTFVHPHGRSVGHFAGTPATMK